MWNVSAKTNHAGETNGYSYDSKNTYSHLFPYSEMRCNPILNIEREIVREWIHCDQSE